MRYGCSVEHLLEHRCAGVVHGHPAVQVLLTGLLRQLLQLVHLRHVVEEHLGRVPVQVDDEVAGVLLVEVALQMIQYNIGGLILLSKQRFAYFPW